MEDFDAVVLDLGLPGMDGLTVLKKWREAQRRMPVIALTARGSWMERVEGIDAGADDYLPKPFQMEELIARIRALVRRSSGRASPLLRVGALSLDERQMRVLLNGVPIDLAPLEYRTLVYLLHNQGRVVSQSELSEHIHGADDAYDSNAIEALIARIRRKIGSGIITTRRGFGYSIEEEPS
jgi:DNA-binding response OmpR family regulator